MGGLSVASFEMENDDQIGILSVLAFSFVYSRIRYCFIPKFDCFQALRHANKQTIAEDSREYEEENAHRLRWN